VIGPGEVGNVEKIGAGWEVPSEVRDRVEFHWFHSYPGKSLCLGVLSGSPVWYVGHFHQGRMVQCLRDGCSLCEQGVGGQIRYVVSCAELSSRQVGVIELGKSPALMLKDEACRNGGLRGLLFEVVKATKSKHSRMEISMIHEHPPAWLMATEPLDLVEVMSRTWERMVG